MTLAGAKGGIGNSNLLAGIARESNPVAGMAGISGGIAIPFVKKAGGVPILVFICLAVAAMDAWSTPQKSVLQNKNKI